jgi:transposase
VKPELRAFTKGLRPRPRTVTAGPTLTYRSGPVEGNVNRIMIKGQMYSRVRSELLRRRILLRA